MKFDEFEKRRREAEACWSESGADDAWEQSSREWLAARMHLLMAQHHLEAAAEIGRRVGGADDVEQVVLGMMR